MLVITRREEQTIDIGDQITVTVVGIEGDKVRIGIEAPRSIPVSRGGHPDSHRQVSDERDR